jgi:tRNA wybutosine-synthesizing protein 1
MSLSGEATLYPRLGEMFKEIRKRGAVSFLVTNGLNPDVIRNFKEDELPTQITISTNAPNEKLFKIWHRSVKQNAWETFNETLDVIKSLKGKVRRVIRLTLVDIGEEGKFNETTNMSEENVIEYCNLIRKAEPDFVHVKGYKSVGYARARMGYDNQPWFEAVKDYTKKLEKELSNDGYKIAAEDERCCVVMLAKDNTKLKIEKI